MVGAVLAASACLAAPVSYAAPRDAGAPAVPWIHAGPVTGYLFYYGADGPWKTQTERVRITTGGGRPGGYATKILWRVRGGSGRVSVSGTRLDGVGRFRQTFRSTPTAGGSYFPSQVVVPTGGCWRVTVSSARRRGRFAFLALAP